MSDVETREMVAPQGGVMLYLEVGNGVRELIVKTDPPGGGYGRALKELAKTLEILDLMKKGKYEEANKLEWSTDDSVEV